MDVKLTNGQKAALVQEVIHYLDVDCYDFTVSTGGVKISCEEILPAKTAETRDKDETEYKENR